MSNVSSASGSNLTGSGLGSHLGSDEAIEVIYLCCVAISGTLGNILIILSLRHSCKMFSCGNLFIANLALSDILVSACCCCCGGGGGQHNTNVNVVNKAVAAGLFLDEAGRGS